MSKSNIKSLRDLRKRKRNLASEINDYEDQMRANLSFMSESTDKSVSQIAKEDRTPLDNIYVFALNAERILQGIKTGIAIYKTMRKQ